MYVTVLKNQRVGIIYNGEVVALLDDFNNLVLRPPFFNLGAKESNMLWELVIKIRGESLDRC